MYYKQVKAFLDNFSKVKVYLFDDLKNDPETFLKDLLNFLEVNSNYMPNEFKKIYNSSGIPKIKFLAKILNEESIIKDIAKIFLPRKFRARLVEIVQSNNFKKIPMKEEDRNFLREYYKDDILELSTLINRDLSHWLK